MFKKNKYLIIVITVLLFSNVYTFLKLEQVENRLGKYQWQTDSSFDESLRLLGRALKSDSDWETKFQLGLNHASKLQVLAENTSYTLGNTVEGKTVLDYSNRLEHYFKNPEIAKIDEDQEYLTKFVKCIEVLASNPVDMEYANKLILLLSEGQH